MRGLVKCVSKPYREPDREDFLATIFGKFYELIIAGYFAEKGYKVYNRGIAIYVEYLEDRNKLSLSEETFIDIVFNNVKLHTILNKIGEEINKLERMGLENPGEKI